MNIPLTTTELVHIVDLLHEDVLACRLMLEDQPLNVRALSSTELSRGIITKITLSSLKPNKNDDNTPKPLLFSERPHLN
jgi:hypothetical protein